MIMRTMLAILALLAAGTTAAFAGSASPVSYDLPLVRHGWGARLFRRLLLSDTRPMPGVGIRAMEHFVRCQPAPPVAAGRGAAGCAAASGAPPGLLNPPVARAVPTNRISRNQNSVDISPLHHRGL